MHETCTFCVRVDVSVIRTIPLSVDYKIFACVANASAYKILGDMCCNATQCRSIIFYSCITACVYSQLGLSCAIRQT